MNIMEWIKIGISRIKCVVINRLFVLVSTNQDVNAKRFKAGRYYLQKGIIENNYNVIVNGKNFYDEPIWYKKTRRK